MPRNSPFHRNSHRQSIARPTTNAINIIKCLPICDTDIEIQDTFRPFIQVLRTRVKLSRISTHVTYEYVVTDTTRHNKTRQYDNNYGTLKVSIPSTCHGFDRDRVHTGTIIQILEYETKMDHNTDIFLECTSIRIVSTRHRNPTRKQKQYTTHHQHNNQPDVNSTSTTIITTDIDSCQNHSSNNIISSAHDYDVGKTLRNKISAKAQK